MSVAIHVGFCVSVGDGVDGGIGVSVSIGVLIGVEIVGEAEKLTGSKVIVALDSVFGNKQPVRIRNKKIMISEESILITIVYQ